MPDIKSLTAADLLRLYRKRELSPVEVTRDQLDRIEKFEPAINGFIIVDRDGALKAAQASEARWQKGEPIGLADGLGATVKDNVWLKGFPVPPRLARPATRRPDEGGRARGRAAARERRGHSRQDHAARIRLDRRLPLAAHRHHAQSVEARPHAPAARPAARRRRRCSISATCTSAPTARARSAFRRPSPACSASSRASAACRPIRPRRSASWRMSGR